MKMIIDSHGRVMKRLRLSLADKCNFRCIYCMPEDVKFVKDDQLMSREDIFRISKDLVSFGINQIRLTGGEPTLRPDFIEIVKDLSLLELEKLSVTTNGFHIGQYLEELKETKCQSINFSLDSLYEENFRKMTRSHSFYKVYDNIIKAHNLGFKVKVNVVVMKGYNDHEIGDFVKFSARTGIEVRFLESMKIGVMTDYHKGSYEDFFMSADEMITMIKKEWSMTEIERKWSSTSFSYDIENGAKVGFIASESKPFCGDCSRLRISATGIFRPCLMIDHGINIKELNKEELYNVVSHRIEEKPMTRIEQTTSSMYQLGG